VLSFLKLLEEQDVGLMSEAGAPGVADPGATFVELAHQNDVQVVPLTGPSSILLALMASGLNGQQFAFHGYLPIHEQDRIKKIKALEEHSMKSRQTEIFMETPHRNQLLLEMLVNELSSATKLCIASNLTMDDQTIVMKRIAVWQNAVLPDLQRRPALFLINAG
jgi:16S rRNA (cytidine1402-2'-O)-methyltransferase